MTRAPTKPQPADHGNGRELQIRRANPARRHEALALLLAGQTADAASAVDSFVTFANDRRLELHELWIACRGAAMIGSILIVPSPGSTAMGFVSATTLGHSQHDMAQLVATACDAQRHRNTRIVQVLLEPHQTDHANLLRQAGFDDLAELLYMQRPAESQTVTLELDAGIECVKWSDANREHFVQTILTSYEDTLDCPALVGLRSIDDIIAGHKAIGQFTPDLWYALHNDGNPVAVMLLSPIPLRHAMELVYLGVSPKWRGHGYAQKLLTHGLGQTALHGAVTMILAVDKINKPALRLYRSMRFTSNARRLAMMYTLSQS